MFLEHFKNLPVVEKNSKVLVRDTLEFPSVTLRRSQRVKRGGVRDFVLYLKDRDIRYRIGVRGVAVEYGPDDGWRKVFIPNSKFYSEDPEVVGYAAALRLLLQEYAESRSWLNLLLKYPKRVILFILFVLYCIASTLVMLDAGI